MEIEMALSDGGREQILQEAQFLNGIAVVLYAAGILGSSGALFFDAGISFERALSISGFGAVCLVACFVLHLIGRLRLRRLDL
jgi:hypothetical protein